MSTSSSRLSARLDTATGLLGLLVLVAVVGLDPRLPAWQLWVFVPLVVLACRWSLMVPTGSADVLLLGLEPCLLLLLLLLAPPSVALLVWAAGAVLAELLSTHSHETRLFNTGLGLLSGGAALAALALLPPVRSDELRGLAFVLVAATAYFTVDLLWTCASIALAEGTPLGQLVQSRALLTGLVCSAAVNSCAYLAFVVLVELHVVAALLLVPFAALLLASHSWSTMRRAEELAAALSTGALALQQAGSTDDVERLVEAHAALVARAPSTALVPTDAEADARLLFQPAGTAPRTLRLAPRHSESAYTERELQAVALLLGVARQEHERQALLRQLRHSASHDALTGLVNRGWFEQLLHEAVGARRPAGLLYGDLDGFKAVNDRLGHAAGDALLVEVAARLRWAVREGDVCARLGGDEFVVLVHDLPVGPDAAVAEATRVAGRVQDALSAPYAVAPDLAVTVSLGLVLLQGDSADEVLNAADAAMYEAKAAGGGRVRSCDGASQRMPRATTAV